MTEQGMSINLTSQATPTPATSSKSVIPDWYWASSGILSGITVIGNGLVIYLITTKRSLQVTCNWFVLSLALADFSCGLFVQPMSFACVFALSCNLRVFYMFFNILMSVSVSNTCMMTLDRYISVLYPLKYVVYMNSRRVVYFVAAAWAFPIALSVLPLTWSASADAKTAYKVHTAIMLALIEFLPPVILLVMYSRLLLTARRHRRQTAIQLAQLSFNRMTVPRVRPKTHDRSVKVIGAVVIMFVLCYALDIYKSICRHFETCNMDPNTVRISLLLVYFNSAVNPMVYALLKRDIRTALKKLFRCKVHEREIQTRANRNDITDMGYSFTVG